MRWRPACVEAVYLLGMICEQARLLPRFGSLTNVSRTGESEAAPGYDKALPASGRAVKREGEQAKKSGPLRPACYGSECRLAQLHHCACCGLLVSARRNRSATVFTFSFSMM